MKIDFLLKKDNFEWNKIMKNNYCAINRHHFLKEGKELDDLDKIESYKENEYVIVDIDNVFKSIEELGKKIYDKYTKEVVQILTYQPVSDTTELKKLLYRWIKLNGFPYYIDNSIGATVSEKVLSKFAYDSILIYLFNLVHKLCATIYKNDDEYIDDVDYLDKLLKALEISKLLDFCISYNKSSNSLPPEAITYGKELLKSLESFSTFDYTQTKIMNINQALIYIVTTTTMNRDELDIYPAQPVFNKKLGMIVLDSFNSLSGVVYHKLVSKITNVDAEEIRCRNCKAWVPNKNKRRKFCDKKECQRVRKGQ